MREFDLRTMASGNPQPSSRNSLQGFPHDGHAQLALDTLSLRSTHGIPTSLLHIMDTAYQERVAGVDAGSFQLDPDGVYLAFQRAAGTSFIDQYIPLNTVTMDDHGYDAHTERTATTGAETVVLDGMVIDSPEAVAGHLARYVFPRLEAEIAECDPDDDKAVTEMVRRECETQELFGTSIVKGPYGMGDGFAAFPCLRYGMYGYVNYLTAFLMYPELMERDFSLQADLAAKKNLRAVRAIREGGLPKLIRLDHDMADSRGTLVDVKALDRLWFPHFERSIQPYLEAGIRLIWHCDGNLMDMVPRLLEVGLGGFQGFQYEDGMDYERICRMTTREGGPLFIIAGVSVTRALPTGTPADVRRELRWLVDNGPETGLFLSLSSSCTPGTPWENLDACLEGLAHYRSHGRGGTG